MKLKVLAAMLMIGAGICAADAHPHVQVIVKSTVQANPEGQITGIRHAWTFDEAFSSYATLGLDTDKDGKLSREELASLAKVNVESLHEYAFFTILKTGKQNAGFADVRDYFLAHDGKALTLHFTLPTTGAPQTLKTAQLEVYDPSFFVAFAFAPDKPVDVEGMDGRCIANIRKPKEGIMGRLSQLGESAFSSPSGAGLDPAEWAMTVRFECK